MRAVVGKRSKGGWSGAWLRFVWPSLVASLLAIGLLAANRATSPYSVVLPGGVYELGPRIHLPADKQRDAGWLAFTAVRVRSASYADWLLIRFDPTARLVPTAQLRPDGTSDRDYYAVRARWMEGSKAAATIVALRRAGYAVEVGGQGALVERIVKDSPADGTLQVGDVILTLDGRPVVAAPDLAVQLQHRSVGAELALGVLRARQQIDLTIRTAASPTELGRPFVGIRTSTYIFEPRLPFPIEVETGNVVGPSAGLMFTLALLDALTPGDLAGGHRVAGTGTIDLDGRVGPVGSVAEKVVAAERQQADVFLVPRQDADEAGRAARGARIVAVGTLDEALAALRELGGQLGD